MIAYPTVCVDVDVAVAMGKIEAVLRQGDGVSKAAIMSRSARGGVV
jgi:hypothetical protein